MTVPFQRPEMTVPSVELFKTIRLEVDAVPETEIFVVEAPPVRLARPTMVEEAEEMKPLAKVESPVKLDVPRIVRVPWVEMLPLEVVVALPPTER